MTVFSEVAKCYTIFNLLPHPARAKCQRKLDLAKRFKTPIFCVDKGNLLPYSLYPLQDSPLIFYPKTHLQIHKNTGVNNGHA